MQEGLFTLATIGQLFEKLGMDLKDLQADPHDVRRAFNFFVTADHMVDWARPDKTFRDGERARTELREQCWLLPLVYQISSGAKHFRALAPTHKSLAGTKTKSRAVFAEPQIGTRKVFDKTTRLTFTIELGPDVAQKYGKSEIDVPVLAAKVFEWWKGYMDKNPQPT